jgi:hypothetical protein
MFDKDNSFGPGQSGKEGLSADAIAKRKGLSNLSSPRLRISHAAQHVSCVVARAT